MIDLWAGVGGLIFAALALGLRCVVLSAEMDDDLRTAKVKLLPNIVEVSHVEIITAGMLQKVMSRRTFAAILLGGGSPCQGNSVLNTHRKGLQDERSWQPLQLQRIATEIGQACPDVPLFKFLENVASAPKRRGLHVHRACRWPTTSSRCSRLGVGGSTSPLLACGASWRHPPPLQPDRPRWHRDHQHEAEALGQEG